MRSQHPEFARPEKRRSEPLATASRPWVPACGSLEPPRQDGENAQKMGKNGEKMGEIRPKTCKGVGITWLASVLPHWAAFLTDGAELQFISTGGTDCFAEFGMTGANSDTNWRTCRFPEAAKVCDFEVGDGVGRGGAGGSEVGPLIISGVSRGAPFLTPTAPCFRPTSARRTTRGAASTVCVNSSQARTVQRFQLGRFAPR